MNILTTYFLLCLACMLKVNVYSTNPDQTNKCLSNICHTYSYENLNVFNTIDPKLLQETVAILSKRFDTNVQIQSVAQLSESERRNLILRITLNSPSQDVPKSLILKQSLIDKTSGDHKAAFDRFVRDWSGLEFLSSLEVEPPLVPRFYGGSIEHRFVLLEDLGVKHISLVDSLTGQDAKAAEAALKRFMERLGQLHAVSYGKINHYLKIQNTLDPDSIRNFTDGKSKSDDLIPKLKPLLNKIDISFTADIEEEISSVMRALFEPGPFITFIHGDICPDNVFDNPDKTELRFIDFEWGFLRNALLDGTYLRMSMPTCWCSRAIPEGLIESLESTYRQELVKRMPAAQIDDAYQEAYTAACAFWMLKAILLVEDVLDHDFVWISGPVSDQSEWKPEANLVRPRVLSRLQAFINISKKYDKLPHIRMMAEQILNTLRSRWPDVKPLELYPAFQNDM